MDMGIGLSEVLLILFLILVFFGSKELPKFLRDAARLRGKLRRYGDKVRQELNVITAGIESEASPIPEGAGIRSEKEKIRQEFFAALRNLSPAERAGKSKTICRNLANSAYFKNARAVMVYVNMGSEVETRDLITGMLRSGKRVLVPYSRAGTRNLGIGEITDITRDIITGEGGAPEPRVELRDLFFHSDIGLIICPGVGFDVYGGRLGRGKAYYDNFLREFKGKVPIVGLAFDCQVQGRHLPFSYNDVMMDQIITEKGYKLPSGGDSNRAERFPVRPDGLAG
jgi:5-formyltetrahydrofolate cyclo-ligase